MPELGSPLFWLIIFLVLVGSFVSASAGFGFAIVLVAALQFFMEPVELVGVITTLGCMGTSLRIIETRRIQVWKRSLHFIIPALFGIPIGVAILKYLDPVLMKRYLNLVLLAGVFMLGYSTNTFHQLKSREKEKGEVIEPLVGFISGILGGSCTLSGPPIVMWGVIRGWKKIEMHAIWARFFFSIGLFSLLNLNLAGLYNRPVIFTSFCLIPAVFVGFGFGIWVRNKITEKRFKIYVLSFLFLSGVTGFLISFNI
ncbi:MAG: sulfite exporter TauE/SafE family protein [Desulfobacteraceae bacterium]|nr:sulfite exporter TauE/SafE family protein [Desulfobacteraceae bacterium]